MGQDGSGARSASIAVMVAASVFREQPQVILMIATLTLFILVLLLPASYLLKINPGPVALRVDANRLGQSQNV